MKKVFWMSCTECAMTEPMQPCEACPNRHVQDKLKCNNPKVNSKNAWALGSEKAGYGVTCYTERDKGVLEFPACGMAGKQWTAKVV